MLNVSLTLSPRHTCLNCDNRHGCRTKRPLCLSLGRKRSERLLSGKQLMGQRGLLKHCRDCGMFRQCWTEEIYRRCLLPTGKKKRT